MGNHHYTRIDIYPFIHLCIHRSFQRSSNLFPTCLPLLCIAAWSWQLLKSFMREEFKLAMNILFEVCAKYINECETHVLTSISEWLCDCRHKCARMRVFERVWLGACLSFSQSVSLSDCLSDCLSVCLVVLVSVCVSVFSVCLVVCVSVGLAVSLSVHLSDRPFV